MKNLHINIVTYVPKDSDRTKLERNEKLILGLNRLVNLHSPKYNIIVNVLINNSNDDKISNHLEETLKNISTKVYILTSLENNLMKARNSLIKFASIHDGENYITQFDDDDYIFDSSYKTFDAFMNSSDDVFKERINLFMFLWKHKNEDLFMPMDLKTNPFKDLGKSIFTFCDCNWIAYAPYLINNFILFPDFLDSGYLEDNYFHMRSCLVNHKANFILSPIYIWDESTAGVSKTDDNLTRKVFNYFKSGIVGYDSDAYIVRNGKLKQVFDTESIDYPTKYKQFIVKGIDTILSVEDSLEFDYSEMRYRFKYIDKSPIRIISTVEDYIKSYTTYQLKVQSDIDPAIKLIRDLVILENGSSGIVNKDSPYLKTLIVEQV